MSYKYIEYPKYIKVDEKEFIVNNKEEEDKVKGVKNETNSNISKISSEGSDAIAKSNRSRGKSKL